MIEFIRREHGHLAARGRCERCAQRLTVGLAAIVLLLALFGLQPADPRGSAYGSPGEMAVLTAFLAVVRRQVKAQSKEVCRELERYLEDVK
jgi:hypothetical protein